ncbi:hypothetical protein [Candidatus Sodalis pierantonius]|uniref:hypothetical protein n=1 Tax=Candidatus Sodalis pierantonii TaxID=1486991 RepID=UPI00046D418D|nr:hypothetical protein [Candidatus Sodalis pierantonius]
MFRINFSATVALSLVGHDMMNDTRPLNALFAITLLLFVLSRLFADAASWHLPVWQDAGSPRQMKQNQFAQQTLRRAGYHCPSPSQLRMDWDGDLLISCCDNGLIYKVKGVMNGKKLKVQTVREND